MFKYPVISSNGNEYEVEMFVGKSLVYAGFNIIISQCVPGLFGRTKTVELRSYNEFKTEEEMLNKYVSYEGIVKNYVRDFEKEIEDQIKYEKLKARSIRQFEEWDGIC